MQIFFFDELDSTNSYLKQNFDEYSNFDIILAHRQNAGYGRFKRNWVDLGMNNIFMSVCLKSGLFNENFTAIAQYTALILAKTFQYYSIKPVIKWPNDILINSKKIAGILAETVFNGSKFLGIVLGVGINISADTVDFSSINQPVTALNIELGVNVDKLEFINLFMKIFEKNYSSFLKGGFLSFKDEYMSYLNSIGKEVSVFNNGVNLSGIINDVSDSGLLLLDINGKIKEISAGDISFN